MTVLSSQLTFFYIVSISQIDKPPFIAFALAAHLAEEYIIPFQYWFCHVDFLFHLPLFYISLVKRPISVAFKYLLSMEMSIEVNFKTVLLNQSIVGLDTSLFYSMMLNKNYFLSLLSFQD